jgi:hypothetical protein
MSDRNERAHREYNLMEKIQIQTKDHYLKISELRKITKSFQRPKQNLKLE